MTTISILNGYGDTKLTWDASDPDQCAEIRQTVADLAAKGYIFFLVDGTPADAVTAGAGMLVVRKLTPAEVVPEVEPEPEPETEPETPADKPRGKRGRPGKNAQNIVAARPVAGG